MEYLAFLEKLKKIKVLITDVDGVWTEGCICYADGELEIKHFNVKDGLGIKRLIEHGIEVIVVTARYSEAVQRRCRELGIQSVYQGIRNKEDILEKLAKKYSLEEIAFVGDDLPDLAVLEKVGVGFTVSNAVKAVKTKADYVTMAAGGKGALREIAELIIDTQKEFAKEK